MIDLDEGDRGSITPEEQLALLGKEYSDLVIRFCQVNDELRRVSVEAKGSSAALDYLTKAVRRFQQAPLLTRLLAAWKGRI